ncbi:MAG: zinc ribbon domain-containing protein [Candidatus Acidiferrales bacterium]|jgi:putative FmdB family regulatory protein
MPIYEYLCDDCGERYELIILNKSTKVTCPNCDSGKNTLQLSVFAAPANGSKASGGSDGPAPSRGCGPSCGCH